MHESTTDVINISTWLTEGIVAGGEWKRQLKRLGSIEQKKQCLFSMKRKYHTAIQTSGTTSSNLYMSIPVVALSFSQAMASVERTTVKDRYFARIISKFNTKHSKGQTCCWNVTDHST